MAPDPIGRLGWQPEQPRRGEFVWEHRGPRDIHAHIARPIVLQLAAAGAYSVLDLGCGNGWFSAALDRCGFQVTGVDYSESGLRIASRQYPELRFARQDVMAPLDAALVGCFDAVVAIDLVDRLTLPRRLVEAALEALKPGGLLIVTSPYHGYMKNLLVALAGGFDSRWDPLDEHGRVKFFSRATLLPLLREFELRDIHFETIGRVPMLARAMLVSGRAPG